MKTPNVGALWIHEIKDEVTGNEHVYMTGYLDFGVFGRVKIMLHSNMHKMKNAQPDYIVRLCDQTEQPAPFFDTMQRRES